MKNLWGCYPNPMRCLYHENLDRKLALLTSLWKPRINIIDGINALDGHGPMFGNPIKMHLLVVSNNAGASDALGSRIMGYNPKDIGHIRVAEKECLGPIDPQNMKLIGGSFSTSSHLEEQSLTIYPLYPFIIPSCRN